MRDEIVVHRRKVSIRLTRTRVGCPEIACAFASNLDLRIQNRGAVAHGLLCFRHIQPTYLQSVVVVQGHLDRLQQGKRDHILNLGLHTRPRKQHTEYAVICMTRT